MRTYHGLTAIPGTSVGAYLTQDGDNWTYSLREIIEGGRDVTLAEGELDMTALNVTPQQVARIAFILELEYS